MTLTATIATSDSEIRYRARQERHNLKRRAKPGAVHVIGFKPELIKLECRDAKVHPKHIGLLDLSPGACKYPYGDGPFTFCGCKAVEGKPYCPPHQELSYGYQVMTVEELGKHRRDYRRKNDHGQRS